jgi:hypothetical protein
VNHFNGTGHQITKKDMAPITSAERAKRQTSGIAHDLSDDELAANEPSWQWIYNSTPTTERGDEAQSDRKRRKVTGDRIVGAKIGQFECRVGDTVMLKADGSNEAWFALICEFVEDDGEGEKAANFMWFSSEKEIRSKDKKRQDYYQVSLGLCKTAQIDLTLPASRMNSTFRHHGTSTPWHPSTARPKSCHKIPSSPDTPKVESLETTQTLVRSLSAGEAATPALRHTRTSSYGRKCTVVRMIYSLLWTGSRRAQKPRASVAKLEARRLPMKYTSLLRSLRLRQRQDEARRWLHQHHEEIKPHQALVSRG